MQLVSQTPIVPGQASTATVLSMDQSGNITPIQLLLPPGKNATLPDTMATTDQLTEFVSGTFGLGQKDLPGIGAHYNGDDGCVILICGNAAAPIYKTCLTPEYLKAQLQNGTGPIKYGVITNAHHGMTVPFPQAFASDTVAVALSAIDSGPSHLRLPLFLANAPNRNNFTLSLNYWTGSTFQNDDGPTTLSYIAIGESY